MNRTIIFDMDGVIIRSEQLWNEYEPAYLRSILDESTASQLIGNNRGFSMSLIYERAKKLGHKGTKEAFYEGYHALAKTIYRTAPITPGIDELIGSLKVKGIKLGLVSSSPLEWIRMVTARLKHGSAFSFIESVNDHLELRPKPEPDGYIAAMKALNAKSTETMIIEDSQTGINAAIASGAHVCCFALHLDGELPHGTDANVHTMKELKTTCYDFAQSTPIRLPLR